jgi:hypothetical protein
MSAFLAENDESYRLMYYRYAAGTVAETPARKMSGTQRKSSGAERKSSGAQRKSSGAKKPAKKESEEIDLFGDDDTPVEKVAKVAPVKPAAKPKAAAKSIIVFDVKVYE